MCKKVQLCTGESAERGREGFSLGLFIADKKNQKLLCWYRQIGERQQGFPWEISFLDRYRDLKVLPSQQTDHELLIKAADSAHIWPVSVGFATICTKHTKAQRWRTVWKPWRVTAPLCKLQGSEQDSMLTVAYHNQDLFIYSPSVIPNNGVGVKPIPAVTGRRAGMQIFFCRQIY